MTIEVPLWLQNGTYAARLDRMSVQLMYDEGVMDLACCKVSQRAAGANYSVDVSTGEFIVQGDDQANQGHYMGRITVVENVAIGSAPGSNSRIDLVGLRINDPNAGGNAGNNATIVVIQGNVAASPVPPATPASTLILAYVTIAAGQPSIQNANISDIRLLAGRKCTPGTVEWIAGPVAPNGWLFCYGQAISRTTYARLFATIGSQYGIGDGSTTFNLPDLRGRTTVAVDNMGGSDAGRLGAANVLGTTGGEEFHTLTTGELPVHNHPVTDPQHFHGPGAGMNNFADSGGSVQVTQGGPPFVNVTAFHTAASSTGSASTGITVGNTGSGTAHNNMPPYILLNGMIRT